MALMLYPANGMSVATFNEALRDRGAALLESAAAWGASVRLGAREPSDPSVESRADLVPVAAALELTAPEEALGRLCDHSADITTALAPIVDLGASRLMAGMTHRVITPAAEGDTFLSLAFRRQPGTSIEDFRAWWLHQHAGVATRHLLPELLAYDQVHVDGALSERASIAAGVTYEPYDAYDNLTWASLDMCVRSTSKPGSEQEIYEDEIGHLDHSTYRGAIMALLK
jgi:hypothetical protein